MLTLTDKATEQIRNLVEQPEVPEGGGLRIANDPDNSALTLSLAAGPTDGDAVVEESGVRVFLEAEAAQLLDDKALDAGVGEDGNVQFALAQKAG